MVKKTKKGSILLITMIIMGIASVLIFSINKISITQQLTNGSYEDSLGAYYAAESGLNIGLKHLSTSTYTETQSLPNGASYNLRVDIGTPAYTITSVGSFGKVKHQIIYQLDSGKNIINRNYK